MSKIEDAIKADERTAAQKAAAKEKAAATRARNKWMKWVKEEQPRISAFREKLDKEFPCLEGDYNIPPRRYMGDTEGLFFAQVNVKGVDLKIQATRTVGVIKEGYALLIPDSQYRDTIHRYDLKGNSDLRDRIKKFIQEREAEEERVQRDYDRMPIGNTD
jgi:hypothetical protein